MHACSTYQRRRPEESVLYPCLARYWPEFRDHCEAVEHSLPHFVEREFESYLRCGILDYGFARVHCPACSFERLVAFSCKGRAFCPSCGARRMEDGAAHLCNEVLPPLIPYRQWVLSFPKPLRYLMAYNVSVCRDVTRVLSRVISRYFETSGEEVPQPEVRAIGQPRLVGSDPAFRLGTEPQRASACPGYRWCLRAG